MLKLKVNPHRNATVNRWVVIRHQGEEMRVAVDKNADGVFLIFDAPESFRVLREKLAKEAANDVQRFPSEAGDDTEEVGASA